MNDQEKYDRLLDECCAAETETEPEPEADDIIDELRAERDALRAEVKALRAEIHALQDHVTALETGEEDRERGCY